MIRLLLQLSCSVVEHRFSWSGASSQTLTHEMHVMVQGDISVRGLLGAVLCAGGLTHVMHVMLQVYANVTAPGGSWERCFGPNAANPPGDSQVFIKATHSFKILYETPNQCDSPP